MKITGLIASFLFVASMAQATLYNYSVTLSGANESPSNASPATGSGTITFDDSLTVMMLDINFSGLLGNTTASHIHSATVQPFTGTAGVATTTPTFAGFPTGVQSGTYKVTLDMTQASSYNPAYITANGGTPTLAFAALSTAAKDGKAYLNIHSSTFGGGEIRGFLSPVPEPSTISFIGLGCGALVLARRFRK